MGQRQGYLAAAALGPLLAVSACGDGDDARLTAPTTLTRLTGTVTSEPFQVDSDLNNPNAPFTANDTPDTAQPLDPGQPLSGYVNRARAGSPGRSQFTGDPRDLFSVHLEAGQSVRLAFDLGDGADLDLYLLDAAAPALPLAGSNGSGAREQVDVPADGDYLVAVHAVTGGAGYLLSVARAGTPPAAAPMGLHQPLVADQAIVRARADHPGAARPAAASGVGREQLLTRRAAAKAAADAPEPPPWPFPWTTAPADWLERWRTLLWIKELRHDPAIAAAEPNWLRYPTAVPADAFYERQWNLRLIQLPAAWDVARVSPDVVVAVIDSGVLPHHPDLGDQLVPGYDFIRDAKRADDGDGLDPDPSDPGNHANRDGSSSFHGSHVAGTIGALTDNRQGVAGVSWQVRLMPLRALGRDGGTEYDVLQALRYAAGLPNDSGSVPERPADVVNLSLAGPGFSAEAQRLIREVRARGIIVVAAAGNSGSDAPLFPAAYNGVTAVAAVDAQGRPARYSSFGPHIALAAPGGDLTVDSDGDGLPDGVLSTVADDSSGSVRYGYAAYQGTSMAAPHVAGVAALMKALAPALRPETFDQLLAQGALTKAPEGRSARLGYGLLDAHKALEAARAAPPPAPTLTATPASLAFAGQVTSALLSLSGSAPVTAVATDAPWLRVSAAQTDAQGLGGYAVAADLRGLAPGGYTATVRFESPLARLEVPVDLRVPGPRLSQVGALRYVLLVDPRSGTTRYQADAGPLSGGAPFRLDGVAPGRYLLYAGSDTDNDGLICDTGDTCGAWPSLADPQPLSVEHTRDGIALVTALGRVTMGAPPSPDDPTAP